ncbi:MAG TPA: YkvA family protein, partial [Kofleriaceae bacterium]
MAHIDVFKSWADTIRQDIEAWKALLESKKADDKSRRLAGGTLQYLVSKMDLIPDWNEGIGVIDDVM